MISPPAWVSPAAPRRAMRAYATYLGTVQLFRAPTAHLPASAASRTAYLADALSTLRLPDGDAGRSG